MAKKKSQKQTAAGAASDDAAAVRKRDGTAKPLKALKPAAGVPLYVAARDAILAAIDDGTYALGSRIPSTAELSKQLDVSLVTGHRALQELVAAGVLRRSQGRGTFVDQRYREKIGNLAQTRIGLVFHAEASLADHYHGHLLEGVRQASHKLHVDVMLLRYGEDVRNECAGFLYVNLLPGDLESGAGRANRSKPTVVVGADCDEPDVATVDTDNRDLAARAVEHFVELGHKRIGFVGDKGGASNSRHRWEGFAAAVEQAGLEVDARHVFASSGWRLGPEGIAELSARLASPGRPTAIFACGYYFALDVYNAAQAAGLTVPDDLSVVGVDDPPSAEFLSPSLTTLRQPLTKLGYESVKLLVARINGKKTKARETMRADFVERNSTTAVE
ncbi:MAG: GntR family transcriptional regulator [Planctomycetota bacterium]